MSPTRKEIDDFIVVAEKGNFSKAADYLSVKQAGLSKSIARLENELGQKLFIRGSRKLKLTTAGIIYYDRAKELKQLWSKAEEEVSFLSESYSGNFSIGCHPVVARLIIPQIFHDIADYPGLKIDLTLMSSRKAVEELLALNLDFAIAVDPIPSPDLVMRNLWEEYIGLYSKSGDHQERVLFHPDMIDSYKLLSSHSKIEKVAIEDYEIISSTLQNSPYFMGLLPSTLGDKTDKLRLVQKISKKFRICLVYRSDMMKTKASRLLIDIIRSHKKLQ